MKAPVVEIEQILLGSPGKPTTSKFLKPPRPEILPPEGLDLDAILKSVTAKREAYFSDPNIVEPLEYTNDEIKALRYWCEISPFTELSKIGLSRYALSLDCRLLTIADDFITKGSMDKGGRSYFNIIDDTGRKFKIGVHILSAKVFLPPPSTEKHNSVDHMDVDGGNNYWYNLRWATPHQQAMNKRKYMKPRHGKPVIQMDPVNYTIIKVWTNLREAKIAMNDKSNIDKAIKFQYITCGYRWCYDYRLLVDFDGTIEEWRLVKDPAYFNVWASSMGRIYHPRSGLWYGYTTPNGRKMAAVTMTDGTTCVELVHRIVALAFIGPVPEGKETVDHIDGNPLNNRPSNLRYLSIGDNIREYALRGPKQTPNSDRLCPVVQLTENGQFIEEYESISEAARRTNVCQSGVSGVLAKAHHTAGGFKWLYSKDHFK